MSLRAVDSAQVIRALKACPERSEELALSAAKGRGLGEDASPEGLIPSLRYAQGKLFRTVEVAEPAL